MSQEVVASQDDEESALGRPPYEPTEHERKQVTLLIAVGWTQDKIAEFIGVAPKTLRKYFNRELQKGIGDTTTMAMAVVRAKLGKTGPQQLDAAKFWLRTKEGFSETAKHEHSGPDGKPIQQEVIYSTGSDGF